MSCKIASFAFLILLAAISSSTAHVFAQEKEAKAIPLSFGYVDATGVSCKWANHCREDLAMEESEYMKFIDDTEGKIRDSVKGTDSDKITAVYEYRVGLQARESISGRCPGRCLTYDFPGDFRNAARLIAKKEQVGVVLDLGSIYYGADMVLKGKDLSNSILDELKKSARPN